MNPDKRNIKHSLKFLLRVFRLKIRSGPLKGKKWIFAAGSRFIVGNYETFKTNPFIQHLNEGNNVIDVGAHVGYYTAIASDIVGPKGQVFAFEPRPMNIVFLKKHIKVNKLLNVKLFEAAVGKSTGTCRFEARTGTGTGFMSDGGNLSVDMVCLDDLYGSGEIPLPEFIKIDVEGGEDEVLEGARQIIKKNQPVILVATHSEVKHSYVTEYLESYGYEFEVLNKEGESGDTEILALPGK